MKIKSNHPLAKHGLVVGEQVIHNGINYTVENESFGQSDWEPDRLCIWKGRSCYEQATYMQHTIKNTKIFYITIVIDACCAAELLNTSQVV